MTAPVAPGTLDRITRRARLMQPYARRHPLDAGQAPTPGHRGMWRIAPTRNALAHLHVEHHRGTPCWHVTVAIWSTVTQAHAAEPQAARQVAEALLDGAGAGAHWWWDPEARVGHLRAPMTGTEAEGVPAGEVAR